MTNQQIRRSAEKWCMLLVTKRIGWMGVSRGRPDNLPSTSRAYPAANTETRPFGLEYNSFLTLRFCPCGDSIIRIIIIIAIIIIIYICVYIYIYIYVYIIYYKVFKSRVIQWFLPGMGCRSLGLRAWPKLALIGLWAIARHGSVEWDENSMAQLDNHQYITYINGSIMIYLIINGI